MKIICIGRNYVKHIEELGNERPKEPVIFLKPDTALLKPGNHFYYPKFSADVHYELEVLIRIKKVGKNIESKFAHKYYDEIGLGIDFTARDLQNDLKKKGLPWEKAKAFDQSAAFGLWMSKENYDLTNIDFTLLKNKEKVQFGNTMNMIFTFDEIISYVSSFMTLKIGDVIFTGTPEGVGAVNIGDHLEGFLNHDKILEVLIK